MIEQSAIIRVLGVQPDFDAMHEINKRVTFLKTYLLKSRQATYVPGISGGVASRERAGRHLHCSSVSYASRQTNTTPTAAVAAIGPDRVLKVDIKPAADSLKDAVGGTDEAIQCRREEHDDLTQERWPRQAILPDRQSKHRDHEGETAKDKPGKKQTTGNDVMNR